MDREARTTALGPMFRQVYNEVDLLVERGFEIAVRGVPVQVALRNREEDHISDPPRSPAAEWSLPRPRGEGEELLPLPKPRLVSLRRNEEPHMPGERDGTAWSFSRGVRAQTLSGPLRYAAQTPWSRSPSSPPSKIFRRAGSRRSRNGSGRITRNGR